jgi:hypothetical protein
MVLTAVRGQEFTEDFTFKNEQGKPVSVPAGSYILTLTRGNSIKQFNLNPTRTGVIWTLTKQDTQELEYNTFYFALTFNGQEITRGVLRVN